MPSTQSQIEANRANAAKSTGPRTTEGKVRAAANSRKHGLCAKQLAIAPEETAAFDSLRTALAAELDPQGELELTSFDQLLNAQWNLRRCRMNEAEILAAHPNPFLDPTTRAAIQTLSTYTSRHQRAHDRAIKELRALQSERAYRTNEANPPSPLVDTAKLHRVILAEDRAKLRANTANLDHALAELEHGPSTAEISLFQYDTAPKKAA